MRRGAFCFGKGRNVSLSHTREVDLHSVKGARGKGLPPARQTSRGTGAYAGRGPPASGAEPREGGRRYLRESDAPAKWCQPRVRRGERLSCLEKRRNAGAVGWGGVH